MVDVCRRRKEMEEKVFGYLRVSTREQNLDRQKIALMEAGIPQDRIYMDRQSGKNFDRLRYKKLLKKLSRGSVLYVKSIDRLGRDYSDLTEQWRIITWAWIAIMKIDIRKRHLFVNVERNKYFLSNCLKISLLA